MNDSPDPLPPPADASAADDEVTAEAPAAAGDAAASPPGAARPWTARLAGPLLMVVLGVAAGGIAALLMGVTREWFDIPAELQAYVPPYPPGIGEQVLAATHHAQNKNLALAWGISGGLISMALGLGAGWLRRSARKAVFGVLDGAAFGALLGAAGGVVNRHVENYLSASSMESIFRAMLTHGTGWLLVGVAVGLAAGAPVGRRSAIIRCVGAAVSAALVAVLLYPVLSAVIFPSAHPELRVPDQLASRVLWTTLAAGLMGIAVSRQCSPIH